MTYIFKIMSKKKKTASAKEKKELYDAEMDKQICQLADQLRSEGLEDNALIIAVARIYANSVLIAYVDNQSLNK